MRDGWQETTLGEVATTVRSGGEWSDATPYVGLEHIDSGAPQIARTGSMADVLSASTPFVPGDILFAKLRPYLRKVAVAHFDGQCSNEALVYRTQTDTLMQGYLGLILQSEAAIRHAVESSAGSRMPRTSVKLMASLTVTLPPLDEQRRMVDLVGALDDTIAAAQRAVDRAETGRPYLLEGLLARLASDAPRQRLDSLGEFVRGKRFTKADYVTEGLGCIHYGQLHTGLGARTYETLTFVPESMRSRLRLAAPGNVVVAAASEDVEGLGTSTVWLGDDEVAVHDDCYIFRHTLEPTFATYLFASEDFHRQKEQFSAGVKVIRISGKDLGQIVVPVPTPEIQKTIGMAMGDFDSAQDAMRREIVSLRTLRTNLLTALLSGEHEIPESYDELLEVAS